MTYNRHNRSNLFVKYNWIDSKIIPNLQKLIISSLASSQIESLSRFLFETGRDIQNLAATEMSRIFSYFLSMSGLESTF